MSAIGDKIDAATQHFKATKVDYPTWLRNVRNGRYTPADGSQTEWGKGLATLDEAKALADAPVPIPTRRDFGFTCGEGPDTVTAMDAATRQRYYQAAKNAGATAVRLAFRGSAHPEITDALTAGLRVLVCPMFAYGTTPSAYAALVKSAVDRYLPLGVTKYQLGNEPNLGPNADIRWSEYADCAKAGHDAAKTANVTVYSGSVANFGVYPQHNADGVNPQLFLERLYSRLGAGWYDVLSFHPYGFYDNATADQMLANQSGWGQFPGLRSAMQKAGEDKPIAVTEHGAPTDASSFSTGVSELEQANFATKSIAAFESLPYADDFYWYSLLDRPSSASNMQGHFGLLRADGAAKPGLAAFKAAV